MGEMDKQLGTEGFSKGEEFRITIAVNRKFQDSWGSKLLKDYSPEEIKAANLRSLCMDEVVLDFEDKAQVEATEKRLAAEGFNYLLYDSGSRGAHFHLKFSAMAKFPLEHRDHIRSQIIAHYGSDQAKKAERTLIAVPGKPHWKSGKPKTLISSSSGTEVCGDNKLPKWVDLSPPRAPVAERAALADKIDGPKIIEEPCPALAHLLEAGVSEGKRNTVRAGIVMWYYKEQKLDKETVIKKVLEWNAKCQPPEDEKQVIKTAMNTMEHAEYGVGCRTWEDFCPLSEGRERRACSWLKRYKKWLDDAFYNDIPVAKLERESDFANPVPDGNLITAYISCQAKTTDAYPEYHLSTVLSVLSMITCRKAAINLIPEPFFVNLWMMLIGDSTVSRKSTAIKIGKRILLDLGYGNKMMPDDSSPEGMIKDMGVNASGAQRFFCQEEFEEFFASLAKDYKSGLAGTYCKLYDCPEVYVRRLTKDCSVLENTFMPLLSATTIQTFLAGRNVPAHLRNGFFARMRVVYPRRRKKIMPLSAPSKEVMREKAELREWFSVINAFFDKIDIQKPAYIEVEPEAINIFNKWYEARVEELQNQEQEEADKRMFFNRLQTDVWKMAFLVRICRPEYREALIKLKAQGTEAQKESSKFFDGLTPDGEENAIDRTRFSAAFLKIDVPDLMVGLELAKIYTFYAERFITQLAAMGNTNNVDKVFEVILGRFDTRRKDVPWSEALRLSHLTAFEFGRCIETLVDSEKIRITDVESGTKPVRMLRPLDPDKALKELAKKEREENRV